MGKIDKEKEYIGVLKTYLGFLLAIILSDIAGLAKLYLSNEINILFWMGSIIFFASAFIFIFIAKKIHQKVESLEEL